MNKRKITLILAIIMVSYFTLDAGFRNKAIYKVNRIKGAMKIDGNWNKPQWRHANIIHIDNYMGKVPSYRPKTLARMLYDDENVYLIFKVEDRYVRSIVEDNNGPVSTDACVEFFFSPDISFPFHYFNLEINAGGTPLMAHHIFPQRANQKFSDQELTKIEIAHSLPKKVDPEITQSITWTIEYKLPLVLLGKYSSVSLPKPGVIWRANFYKTASKTSNPHWITWSPVKNEKPNFHLPQFFGQLQFQ